MNTNMGYIDDNVWNLYQANKNNPQAQNMLMQSINQSSQQKQQQDQMNQVLAMMGYDMPTQDQSSQGFNPFEAPQNIKRTYDPNNLEVEVPEDQGGLMGLGKWVLNQSLTNPIMNPVGSLLKNGYDAYQGYQASKGGPKSTMQYWKTRKDTPGYLLYGLASKMNYGGTPDQIDESKLPGQNYDYGSDVTGMLSNIPNTLSELWNDPKKSATQGKYLKSDYNPYLSYAGQ